MVEILIGTDGWNYFNVPGDKLSNYSKAFRTLKVNSTFYIIPKLSLVNSWRKRVLEDFEFSVRCNRGLIQKLRSESLDSALIYFESMKLICSILRAKILHVLIPYSWKMDDTIIDKIDDFLSIITLLHIKLAFEARLSDEYNKRNFTKMLSKHSVIRLLWKKFL